MAYVDPVILLFYIMSIIVFIAATFKLSEFRGYTVGFLFLFGSIIFMVLEIHEIEAILLCLSGVTTVFGVLYYRAKVKIEEKGG